jgi:hypothetical protein
MHLPSVSGAYPPEAAGAEGHCESGCEVKHDLDPFEAPGLLTAFTKTEEELTTTALLARGAVRPHPVGRGRSSRSRSSIKDLDF